MARMPYEPIIPEGHHLGTSRNVDGAVTGHIFEDGTNELKSNAAWVWVDDPDSSDYDDAPQPEMTSEERELIDQATVLIVALVVLGALATAPHVIRWWNEIALPAVKRTWYRITRRPQQEEVQAATIEFLELVETEITDDPQASTSLALSDPVFTMSSVEWAQRFRAMIAATEFRNMQALILQNAQLMDGPNEIEGSKTPELTPAQFADRVRSMLVKDRELLTEETVLELQRVLDKKIQ